MINNENTWYRLDNAGKLFPSISSDIRTTVFRVSVTLYKTVDHEILQIALNHIIKRFPYYQVYLKRGFFWYYFERTKDIPKVENEIFYPCTHLEFHKNRIFPFRIIYYKKRISLEIAHCLSDGTGAMVFLKSLIYEYFNIKGIKAEKAPDIFTMDEKIEPEEHEYSFKKYYKKTKEDIKTKRAVHFPFRLFPRGIYHIVTGIIPVKTILGKSKEYGISLTVFLLALYFDTIIEYIKQNPEEIKNKKHLPITMNVPVNLRSIFPSKTMRNFFLSIVPAIHPPYNYTFEELLNNIQSQMKEMIKKENLSAYISRNVSKELSVLIRLFPLILKDLFLPLIYIKYGENLYTSSISNLGKITMPDPLNDHIERFEFYPSPSRDNIIKIGAASYKDKLYFTFGKLTDNTEIEKIFFRKLIKLGIPVKVQTN